MASHTDAVDVIFEHRRAGMIFASGETLVSSRVRLGDFWIAAPDVEYSYLLAKKAVKGKASLAQALRLKRLVESLGREKAEENSPEKSSRRISKLESWTPVRRARLTKNFAH